jgi:hypothetical protein
LRSEALCFIAIDGTVVDVTPVLTPDHGAGSQGEQMKTASLVFFNVSVPFLGLHALSVLQ